MNDFIINSLMAFKISMIAYVYSCILTGPGEVFSSLYKKLEEKLSEKWPRLFKVLIDCEKCIAGQLALWSVLVLLVRDVVLLHGATGQLWTWELFRPVTWFYIISLAIFFTQILKRLHRWLKGN